jgi:hypothetical protein
MRYGVVVVFIVAGILSGSCGGKRVEDGGEGAAPGAADSLEARISLNEGSYAVREPVVMTLTVRNITDRTLNLTFPTAQRYDFIVGKGKLAIWQWC